MKTKGLNILLAGIFAVVFLMSFASATLTFSTVPTLSKNVGTNTIATITITSDTDETVTFSGLDSIIDVNGKAVNFTLPPSVVLVSAVSQSVSLYYTVPEGFNFKKTYSATLTSSTGIVSTVPVSQVLYFEDTPTEGYSDNGHLSIATDNINVEKGYGEDYAWYPFDEISAKINVENNGNEKIKSIVVSYGLYNTVSGRWIFNNKESSFSLADGDDKTLTVNFKLDDPRDFKNDDAYVFYAWATGTDETNNFKTSVTTSDPIDIISESDFVVLDNIQVPETIQCDSEVLLSADIWNIGSDDQTDVYVKVYNKELGIDKSVNIGDIDSFESSDFNLNLQLPEGIKEKQYPLTLTVYDSSKDVYQNENNDKSIATVFLNVQGNCSLAKVSVTAVLESGGRIEDGKPVVVAGKQMVVKATILNTGDKTSTYLLNAAAYTIWASSANLSKNSLTLDAGKSEDVLITFDVNKDAIGTNLFNLEVLSGNELIVSQPVQVEITKKGFGITGNFFSADNKYIWGIGALNLILIVLIIVIAVRISRK